MYSWPHVWGLWCFFWFSKFVKNLCEAQTCKQKDTAFAKAPPVLFSTFLIPCLSSAQLFSQTLKNQEKYENSKRTWKQIKKKIRQSAPKKKIPLKIGRKLQLANRQTLREKSMFGHHWPFSGTIWSINPNFDTEIRNFMSQRATLGGCYGLKCKFCLEKIMDLILIVY